MNRNALLTITSLLSILLLSLHVTDDIVRGMDAPGIQNLTACVILAILLYGTLVLRGRLMGYIATLLTSVFALGMPVIHMRGARFAEVVASPDGFFFLWTLFALGVAGLFGIALSMEGLWSLRPKKR